MLTAFFNQKNFFFVRVLCINGDCILYRGNSEIFVVSGFKFRGFYGFTNPHFHKFATTTHKKKKKKKNQYEIHRCFQI